MPRSVSRWPTIVTVVAAASVLAGSGCATGQRPTLGPTVPFPAGALSGDPATDAVLNLLDQGPDADATIEYATDRVYDPKSTPAKLEILGDGRQITIGEWIFRLEAGAASTCPSNGDESSCVDGWRQERISDTNLSAEFWGPAAAVRLRREAAARLGPGVASTRTVAGQTVTCAAVPLSAGTATFCAFDLGLLAVMEEGDVRVEATSFQLAGAPAEPTTDPATDSTTDPTTGSAPETTQTR